MNKNDFNSGFFILKFSAQWCGPCKLMNPILEKLESEFSSIKFVLVDADQESLLTTAFKINAVPTLIFLKDGIEIHRVIGLTKIDCLRDILSNINKDLKEEYVKTSRAE